MREGLRERKKRLTRRRIADVALGLFVERGFDQVTIAEVAERADVSVNTVYNYFATKEDLVLPPDQASPDRLADIVRGRGAGESAAVAVLGRLRDEVRRRDRVVGLTEGFGRVLAMMLAAPTLAARLEDVSGQMVRNLAALLAEETGATEGDPVPRLVAGQIGWFHGVVFGEIGQRTVAGEDPESIAAAALTLLDEIEALLGTRVLTYAVRTEEE
ncbi:TetR/AcrR family transcriptional regulator [Amycolatopsis sp. 195334CR]|uniref:TetR/AcrR family transcriptional regulator n=1 Tax=Amycolatopsis sp. 195334CR TaxID=2814588 RepID=UPI001A9027C8|nr:TetR/AcrR family transcriptional regulator [Amycolatopsis sp. 195334CR]MBN6041983.1 TetR/AcrR family transcriptional regulator [Amycolatopsis sp. 195334CR]